MMQADHAPPRPQRIDLVDLARGLALAAMFVFHFAYDLSTFRLIETDIAADPGWSVFARLIAGSFLAIVGFSLILASRHNVSWRAWFSRLARVAGAAAAVTVVTWFAIPEKFIFFGILHHIVVASLLALALLRLPAVALALSGAAIFALALAPAPAALDRPWLFWLGLADSAPPSADFVPLVPWFGCVLLGMALGKFASAHPGGWSQWQARALPARIIAWSGRHSLAVYLLHQPVFIALLLGVSHFALTPAQEARPFRLSCERSCVSGGSQPEFCEKACACAVAELKRAGLWRKALFNRLDAQDSARAAAETQACFLHAP